MAQSTKADPLDAAIIALAEAFRQKPTEAMVEAYRIGLDDLPIHAVKTAVVTAIRTCKFMPSAGELRELAGEMRLPDRAILAFVAFEKALGRNGTYQSLDFDDRAINATVRALGGLERICEVPADEWQFLRKRFTDTYCAYVRAGVSVEAGMPCCGYFDRTNTAMGYDTRHLTRIETGLPALTGITGPPQGTVRLESDAAAGPRRIGEIL